MAQGSFHNRIWGEGEWEAHINELEDKSRRLKHFITPHGEENNPRWLFLLRDYDSELEVVDTYVMEELIFEEAYFPDDQDQEWDEEEEDMWDELTEYEEDRYFMSEEEDELEEGDEWKRLSEDYLQPQYESIEYLDLYIEARQIGASMLAHARSSDPRHYTLDFIRLVDAVLKIATKIVAGYALGFEKDLMGGNIVYNKKALRWANYALTLMHKQKQTKLFTREEYFELHESIFELRNDMGIYVQDLRDQFESM